MFAGMGIVVAGASFKKPKAKVLGAVLLVVGAVLLGWVYLVIVAL
jgi:hypothetical protein